MKRRLYYLWRIFAERNDQAWIDGNNHAEAEWIQILDDKDNFIGLQAELLRRVDEWLYQQKVQLPEELDRLMADYR